VTLTVADGHATLARVDTVVARVRDNAYDASGFTDADVVLVQGTPGAGAPTLPTNCVPLRDITVPAGASAGAGGLSSSNLGTDRRVYLNTAIGANEKALSRVFVTAQQILSSTTYAVLPNATERAACQMSFTKRRADTKLILDVRGNARAFALGATTTATMVGLRVNGTDVDMATVSGVIAADTEGANNAGLTYAGVRELTGVAAGTFTVEPVYKAVSSGYEVIMDPSHHYVSFSVREVPV
jgi:hypothetical protein